MNSSSALLTCVLLLIYENESSKLVVAGQGRVDLGIAHNSEVDELQVGREREVKQAV
jgi:hypothetical protein